MTDPQESKTDGCALDSAPMASVALHHPIAIPGAFVVFKYVLPSDVALVSPFAERLMDLIACFPGADGSETGIELALAEALSNAMIHGNHRDPLKHVSVSLRCDSDGEVSLTIQDEGAGFDTSAVPDPTAPEHLMREHGRGIYLMRALMDDISYENGGTVVHMSKRRTSRRRVQ